MHHEHERPAIPIWPDPPIFCAERETKAAYMGALVIDIDVWTSGGPRALVDTIRQKSDDGEAYALPTGNPEVVSPSLSGRTLAAVSPEFQTTGRCSGHWAGVVLVQ